jgi:hypothetical protein
VDGFRQKTVVRSIEPLYGFGGRRTEPIGSISLSVSFSSLHNACTEYTTFVVVDMNYPYNAFFCRGLLNTFEAALHSLYHRLKVPAALAVISIHGSQKNVRKIEQGFTPRHRNVNCFQDEKAEGYNDTTATKCKESFASRPAIEP